MNSKLGANDNNKKPKRPAKNSGVTCPMCDKQPQKGFLPFCSSRCSNIDLSRWLTGHYAIPVVEEDGSTPSEENLN